MFCVCDPSFAKEVTSVGGASAAERYGLTVPERELFEVLIKDGGVGLEALLHVVQAHGIRIQNNFTAASPNASTTSGGPVFV